MQWMVLLVCLVAGLALHGRNHQRVHFDVYVSAFDLPLSVLLIGALGAGVMLGLAAVLPGLLRQRLRLRRVEAELRRLASSPPSTQPGEAARDP